MLGINYHPFLKDYLQEDAESDIFSNLNKSGISGINQPVSSNERFEHFLVYVCEEGMQWRIIISKEVFYIVMNNVCMFHQALQAAKDNSH